MTDPVNGLVTQVEAALASLALPQLTNIQTAFTTVANNPGNQTILLQQEAVVVANVNTLIAEAPAIVPLLQSAAISAGATQAADLLGKIIAALQAKIVPPAPAPEPTPAPTA